VTAAEGPLYLSANQLRKLGACENDWVLSKIQPWPEETGPEPDYFILGNLLHRLTDAWWARKPWRQELLAAMAAVEPDADGYKDVGLDKIHRKAERIMTRYEMVYGTEPPAGQFLVGTEIPFDLPVPGTKRTRVRGFLDGLKRIPVDGKPWHDELRIREAKSMGRWGREKQVPYADDTWLYIWAARQSYGLNVSGLDFEAISTFDYKAGDDDPAKAFKSIPVEYDQGRVDLMLDNLRRASVRAEALIRRPALAVRAVGDQCLKCQWKTECLGI
jgi:hypothetical protein